MQRIAKEELAKLPYLRNLPEDGRAVPLYSYFDHTTRDWHLYVDVRHGELGRMAGGEVVSGSYLGMEPADQTSDLEFPLGALVVQHLSFPSILAAVGKLESDVHRFAAVLEKYHIISSLGSELRSRASLLVESELEYLCLLARAFYDMLQGVVREIGARLIVLDGTNRRAVHDLPNSFADVALRGEVVQGANEIQVQFRLPRPIAVWYEQEAPFFREIRGLRDSIAHHGRNLPTILWSPWGFAVDPSEYPWSTLQDWSNQQLWDGRLGSLRSVFASIILHSLQAAAGFVESVPKGVQLPRAIGDKDLKLFIRSPFGHRLISLPTMLADPWEERKPKTEEPHKQT